MTQESGRTTYAADDARAAISELTAARPVESEDTEDIEHLFAPLTKEEAINCMFSSWYPQFRSVTFKSEIIKPLEQTFIDYLLADGVFVPEQTTTQYHGELEEFGGSESNDSDWDDDDSSTHNDYNLESTSSEIRHRIERLGGGEVFPRMNWCAPTDASWVATTGTLRCRTAADIYWLLKSSDKVTQDLDTGRYLSKERLGTIEPELVLRKWGNLAPSMMFRCFVKGRQLLAVSQVDYQHHEFLDEMSNDILAKLVDFFTKHVTSQFPSENYCFDAYIAQTGTVYVVDFEPWTHSVDSCLFEWRELVNAKVTEFLGLRLFPDGVNPLGHFSAKYSTNRFPVEMTADAYRTSVATLIEKMKKETL
ncbi:D123-domain-containing protein [Coemansia reversa NRRL 1564]|uniref:D123-domain-containing protein n=1 Tax=Coemansia reversa (strain ATCC 12441 / NRRL 1564) TaxID=763665 RepID=A0A2G5BDH5_COERN|nr:D123-domain-containing protein [Coemansia reversa NRRL 1564]|eukprot:PIA17061.1 D123-domain-containing protein [Coemansia reversa NRRL 1564]